MVYRVYSEWFPGFGVFWDYIYDASYNQFWLMFHEAMMLVLTNIYMVYLLPSMSITLY